jgi:hypothetical protein
MSATEQVWVIEISSSRDDFKSYMAGPDGPDDFLWVEDPAEGVHFLSEAEALTVAETMGMHGHAHCVAHMRPVRAQFELPLFLADAA